ncbi:MAG: protein PacB [Pseudomonadota bacterium]
MARKHFDLLHSNQYLDFCARYHGDLVGYVLDHSRYRLTWQQLDVAEAIQEPGARVAAASGHGTGKSHLAAWVIDWNIRVYPFSNSLLTATNITQVRSVVWKYLDQVMADMDKVRPWMRGLFVKKAQLYFHISYKDSWFALPKTASKGAAENIAGQHNKHYIVIVDEASGVPDEIHGVMRGALTEGADNRYLMFSQPTRTVGHFADAFGKLSGIYRTFHLNAELSPLVDKTFIREKLIEYGGHHSPEYQIKVLGKFPDNLSGFLIPARWLEQAQDIVIVHAEPWGWVLTADVAEGLHRDESVWEIAKVSGFGEQRRVEIVEEYACSSKNEKEFARMIYQRIQSLPQVTIAIDGDGAGRTVILELEELGVMIEPIHWGLPPHTKTDQKRYFNQRAYASVKVREAVFEERMKVAPGKTIVEQGSKIPYDLDDKGRYRIWTKERMRSHGIKSPDRFDAHAFFFLVDYIPLEDGAADGHDDEMVKWATEILEGEAA